VDGRTFWVRPVGSWVLESSNVVAEALAVSLDKPLEWAVGFFFGNTEFSTELWTVIAEICGLTDTIGPFSPLPTFSCQFKRVDRSRRVKAVCISSWKFPVLFDKPPHPQFLPIASLAHVIRIRHSSDELLSGPQQAGPLF